MKDFIKDQLFEETAILTENLPSQRVLKYSVCCMFRAEAGISCLCYRIGPCLQLTLFLIVMVVCLTAKVQECGQTRGNQH